jgi:hypothetical protein
MERELRGSAIRDQRPPVVGVLLAAAALAGCGGGEGSGGRKQVEALIRSQLPESVHRNTGEAVLVNEVTCVDKGDGDYECIAAVTGTDGAGGLTSFDLPVSATCDEENCTWRSR